MDTIYFAASQNPSVDPDKMDVLPGKKQTFRSSDMDNAFHFAQQARFNDFLDY